MSIAMHPYLSGSPHRIKYVRETFEHILSKPGVVCWDGEQILDWFSERTPGAETTETPRQTQKVLIRRRKGFP